MKGGIVDEAQLSIDVPDAMETISCDPHERSEDDEQVKFIPERRIANDYRPETDQRDGNNYPLQEYESPHIA